MKAGKIISTTTLEPFDITEKRFYVPMPVAPCPKCDTLSLMRGKYLSYPTANKAFAGDFVCPKCNPDPYEESKTFSRKVFLHVALELF